MVEELENETQTLCQSTECGLPKGYNPHQVEEGVKAMIQSLKKLSSRKKTLFEEDGEIIRILVTCVRVPVTRSRNYRFILPHGYLKDTSEVCLFVQNLSGKESREYEDDVRYFKNLLSEAGVKTVSEVISVNQYKQEYKTPEMRRRLSARFECILADSVVSDWLHGCLGKQFHRCKKLPTPVKMRSKDLKGAIDKALHKTVLPVSGKGNNYSAKIGNTKQSVQQICENIEAFVKGLQKDFPGKWGNIKSLHIRTENSVSIPIYFSLVLPNAIKVPKVKPGSRGKKVPKVTGDLTTLPNGYQVQVLPDGTVNVKGKKANGKEGWLTYKEIKRLKWDDTNMSGEDDNAEEDEKDNENFISGSEEEGEEDFISGSEEEEEEEGKELAVKEDEISDSEKEAKVEAAEEEYLRELSMKKEVQGKKRKEREEDPVASAKKHRKTSKGKQAPVSTQWQVSDVDNSDHNEDIEEESKDREKKTDFGSMKKAKNKKKNTPKSSVAIEEDNSNVEINKGKIKKSIKKEIMNENVGDSRNEMVSKPGNTNSSVKKKIDKVKGKNNVKDLEEDVSGIIPEKLKGKLRKKGNKLTGAIVNGGMKGRKKGK